MGTTLDFTADLNEAFDAAEAAESAEGVEPVEPVSADPEPADELPEATEPAPQRSRDDTGRFAKVSKKSAPSASPKATAAGRAAADGVSPPPEAPSATPVAKPPPVTATVTHDGKALDLSKPPQSLGPAAREKWGQVPVEVREAFAKREVDVAKSIGQAVENKTFRDRFVQAVEPHADFLRNNGLDLHQTVSGLLGDARVIWQGTPQAKAQRLAQIIKSSNTDINMLAAALDGEGSVPQQPQGTGTDDIDARIERGIQARIAAAHQQKSQSEMQAFAAKAEFWPDVQQDVFDIMELGRRRGVAVTIQDAYNRAIQLSPEISGVMKQREAGKNAAQANASTQRSRAAASLVKSQPAAQMARAQPKKGDWTAAVTEAWDSLEG